MEVKKQLLTKSLIENKLEFIKIFAEILDLKKFLTKKKLEEIYKSSLELSAESFLHDILKRKKGKGPNDPVSLDDIQSAMFSIEYKPQYAEPASTKDDLKTFLNPKRELFVYSLLFIRLEASEYFWENLSCKISSALFAVLISEKILGESVTVRGDRNLQAKVHNMNKKYEFQAKGVLNSCFVNSTESCQKLLTVVHESWGSKTCIDLAIQANCREFIAQSGCQKLLQHIWWGNLYKRPGKNEYLKIWLLTILPFFFLPFLSSIKFDDDDDERETLIRRPRKTFPLKAGASGVSKVWLQVISVSLKYFKL